MRLFNAIKPGNKSKPKRYKTRDKVYKKDLLIVPIETIIESHDMVDLYTKKGKGTLRLKCELN